MRHRPLAAAAEHLARAELADDALGREGVLDRLRRLRLRRRRRRRGLRVRRRRLRRPHGAAALARALAAAALPHLLARGGDARRHLLRRRVRRVAVGRAVAGGAAVVVAGTSSVVVAVLLLLVVAGGEGAGAVEEGGRSAHEGFEAKRDEAGDGGRRADDERGGDGDVVSGPDSLKPRKESTNRPSTIAAAARSTSMSYSSVTMSTTNLYAVPPTSNAPVSDSRSATIANTS